MHKISIKCIIITLLVLVLGSANVLAAEYNNSVQNSTNNTTNTSTSQNYVEQESTATTLLKMKNEQLKTMEDCKAWIGSDTYGIALYILLLIQRYSIPIGIVGIALCAIYQYVIGIKRLDIRDKGFNTMIAMVTILIICQVLPLIFVVVVKSND